MLSAITFAAGACLGFVFGVGLCIYLSFKED